MNFSFTFDGIKKDYLVCGKKGRSAFAPITRNLIAVSGLPGSLLESTTTEIRTIEIPVTIVGKDRFEVRKLEEDLSAWLIHDEPKELVFDDEPDRVYYALVDGSIDIEDVANFGRGTLRFICPDPYKYGQEKEVTFESSASFDVEGTAETEPVIEVTLNGDTEYVAVSNGTDINMVGFPAKQEETVTEWQTPILMTGGESLVGWTVSSDESVRGSNSPIMGELKSDGDHFYTDDYGNDPYRWHGPAMKTSLKESLQDFRFDMGFIMRTTGREQSGAIEVSILDANNQILCAHLVAKHYPGMDRYYGRVEVRGAQVIPESQIQLDRFFQGIYRIYRMGTRWEAFVWQLGLVDWTLIGHQVWHDTEKIATAKATQVQMRILQRASFPVCEQIIDDVQVYRLNDLGADQVPIIGRAEDKIIFDHKNDNIAINGESVIAKKAFIGNYFKLQPGRNNIAVEPADKIQNVKVRWRDKWR